MANSIFPLGSGRFGKFKKKRFDTLGHLLWMLREKLGGETLLGIVKLGMLGFSTKELGSNLPRTWRVNKTIFIIEF
jgi:hypothetical protein